MKDEADGEDERFIQSLTAPFKPVSSDRQYYYIPFEDTKPCMHIKFPYQDHRRRLYLSNMLYKIMERLVRTSLKWFLLYLASAIAALIMHFLAIVIGLDNQLSAYSWLKYKNDLIKKFLCLMGLIFIPSKER